MSEPNPSTPAVAITQPKPFVFVLMPFDASFDDTYKLGIKPTCEDAGAYCERVDEQFFDESIFSRILNQIAKADVIVADMSGRNPNVFYEVGYAHALGKRVILLTQKTEDIPFDLKHHPHIVYGGKIVALKEELLKRVKWSVQNPTKSLQQTALGIELFIQGKALSKGLLIQLPLGSAYQLKLDIHNSGLAVLYPESFQFGFIYDANKINVRRSDRDDPGTIADLPDGKKIRVCSAPGILLPSGWDTLPIEILGGQRNSDHGIEAVVVRIFSEVG